MKRVFSVRALVVCVVCWLLSISGPSVGIAEADVATLHTGDAGIRVYIDGELFEPSPAPYIENGRVLVPMRALLERLGARVIWNPENRTVYALNSQHQVMVTIGSRQSWNDGWKMRLDVPAQIKGDRTYLPLRFTAEAMGAAVSWDPNSRTVRITRGRETEFTLDEIRSAAATLTPYVNVNGSNQFSLTVPSSVWLPVSPSALRQLRQSMATINQFVTRIPEGELVWESFDGPRLTASGEEGQTSGIESTGKEPVVAARDRSTNRTVKVHWWLTKWYVDDNAANEIKWMLLERAAAENITSTILGKFPPAMPYEIGLQVSSYLLGGQALALEKCITQGQGRGVVIYVLFPRNYGWCEPR